MKRNRSLPHFLRIGYVMAICWLALAAALPTHGQQTRRVAALDVPLALHEVARVDVVNFPVSVVVPLPQGQFHDPAQLGVDGVPSQVEVMERWAADNSLRHVLVHFLADVPAEATTTYHFTDGGRTPPVDPVTVISATGAITVATGPLQLRIDTQSFNLFAQVWLDDNADRVYGQNEVIVANSAQDGGVFAPRAGAGSIQYDSQRTDLQVTVEESGPVRAVVRVEAPARFITTTAHLHGFVARIYAYAGQPFVRVDYQLANSDKTVTRSWPLYFEAMTLDVQPQLNGATSVSFGLGDDTVARFVNSGGALLAQERHDTFRVQDIGLASQTTYTRTHFSGPDGYVDLRDSRWGVMGVIRNFWQTWPNGLAVDAGNRLALQLWPDWSAQWHAKQLSPSGLYWLEDMQHNVKETLFYFHPAAVTDEQLIALARAFQFPPVAVLPADWYATSSASLDLGGVVPTQALPTGVDKPRPLYGADGWHEEYWFDAAGDNYGAGWVNFGELEPGYRSVSCVTGGWPYTGASFVATGAPGDYFDAEAAAQGEINLRPQWMAQYTYAADAARLQLTENPYCGGRWRIFEGHGVSKFAAPLLPNTGNPDESPAQYARDDQHGWFYHVADAYWLTGNLWLRDWYTFIGQFRRTALTRQDPFPDTSSRAIGHSLNHALQAYRATGDRTLLAAISAYLRDYLIPAQDPFYGDQRIDVEASGGGFQTGYLMRAVVNYLEEVRAAGDWQAYAEGFNYLSGLMAWNYHYGNFAYYFDARQGGTGQSSGTGLTLVDPQAWYYVHTGKDEYWSHLLDYVDGGVNGGEPPYGNFTTWAGQFEGRYYLYASTLMLPAVEPPAAITDLAATRNGTQIHLRWTAPDGAARYHIVWSDRPIVETHSLDPNLRNWWAAHAVGPTLTPQPNAQQTLTIEATDSEPVYVAVFTFDSFGNMSTISNVAQSQTGQPSAEPDLFLPHLQR